MGKSQPLQILKYHIPVFTDNTVFKLIFLFLPKYTLPKADFKKFQVFMAEH